MFGEQTCRVIPQKQPAKEAISLFPIRKVGNEEVAIGIIELKKI